MEEKLIKAIANLYMEDLCNIHYPAQQQRDRKDKKPRGIKQGCNISPTLFNGIINESIRKLNRTSKSRSGDPSAVSLLTDNEQELKAKIKFIQRELSKVCLKKNNSKVRF